MPRLVKRFRALPYAVTVGGETKSICGCGLSATLPYCDGTHKIAEGEDPVNCFWYDDAGARHTATGDFAAIRSDQEKATA